MYLWNSIVAEVLAAKAVETSDVAVARNLSQVAEVLAAKAVETTVEVKSPLINAHGRRGISR